MKNIVYLLNAYGTNRYKIGVTSDKNINSRLKQIQTGCPEELHLFLKFKTKYATVMEKFWHKLFRNQKTQGEWFELTDHDVLSFQEKCTEMDKKYIFLENNNIFFKKRLQKK